MQIKDVIIHLARKAKLVVKGRPDSKLLRFHGKAGWYLSFVINSTNIVGYKWLDTSQPELAAEPGSSRGISEQFDICNPGSLRKILAFMCDYSFTCDD